MLFVAQHHDIGVIIGVEHQPFYLHLCNHDKPVPLARLWIVRRCRSPHADGSRSEECSISETGLSTKPARSLEKFTDGSSRHKPGWKPRIPAQSRLA